MELSLPHEPDSFIQAIIEDIHKYVKEPKCLLCIGAGDGYEAIKISKAFGCEYVLVDARFGDPPVSIGPCDGMGMLFIYDEPGLTSLYVRPQRQVIEAKRVTTVSLDSFCEQQGIQPDILLIDAEGSTGDVLIGGSKTLAGVKLIAAETETRELFLGQILDDSICETLKNMGLRRIRCEEARGVPQRNSVWVRG